MSRRVAVTLIASALAIASPSVASASVGSVPAEIAAYAAAPDGLLKTLEEFVGIGPNGQGLEFGDASSVGQLNRVFTWTDAYLAGEETDMPVQLSNQWTAPVLIDGKAIGLAVIWINPGSEVIELADFLQDIDVATALSDVAAGQYVVQDADRAAWFTLEGVALSPVVNGTSGLDGPTTLSVYQGLIAMRESNAVAPADVVDQGSALSIATIAGAVVIIIAVMLFPFLTSRRRRAQDASAPHLESPTPAAVEPPAGPEPAVESAVVEPPVVETAAVQPAVVKPVVVKPIVVEAALTKAAAKKPPVAKPTGVRGTVAKPAGVRGTVARPTGVRGTVARPAGVRGTVARPTGVQRTVAKPAVVKPAVAKAVIAKPVAVKPAAVKPAAVKPAAVKRPAQPTAIRKSPAKPPAP